MLYVSRKKDNKYGVIDTEDCVEEFYTKEELREIHKLGLKIKGITDTGVKIVNWEQEPEYLKAKTLHYQLEIISDNKVKVVSKPEDLPIPKFCCQYDYSTDADGLMIMSGRYLGGNLVIPKFVNKLEIAWGRYNKVILSGGSGLITLDNCFNECDSLEEIYLGNLDVSNVENMNYMFWGCKKLQNIDSLRNWNVSRVKSMNDMFCLCKSLQNIDSLRNWDVSKVKFMGGMFSNCKSLQNIDNLRSWDVSSVENMNRMFDGCMGLQNIAGLNTWNVSKVVTLGFMFSGCKSLQNIDALRNWNIHDVEATNNMFEDCISLQSIDAIANWTLSPVCDVSSMFKSCINLRDIDGLMKWISNYINVDEFSLFD